MGVHRGGPQGWIWQLRVRLQGAEGGGAAACNVDALLQCTAQRPLPPSIACHAALSSQATLIGGAQHHASGSAATEHGAAEARQAHVTHLYNTHQLSDEQLRRNLNLGEGAPPRSRVKGVSFYGSANSHSPAGRPWCVRLDRLQQPLQRQVMLYLATQREAEAEALACHLRPGAVEHVQQLRRGQPRQPQQQPQLQAAALAQLVVGFATAGPLLPPAPVPLQGSPPEEFLAEEGLPGSQQRLSLESSSHIGGLLLRWARYQPRVDALGATRREVLRAACMPVLHHLCRLTPPQVLQLYGELSRRRGQRLFPHTHVDHSPPMVWLFAQLASGLGLEHTGPLDA